jgi:8-oxo-dGTP diphosphatase
LAYHEIHVVAGVLEDEAGRVLISQRPTGKSFAGAWEFPGGKLTEVEGRFGGLARELEEELGIQVEAARPLIRYRHVYPDLRVDLDAWRVNRWCGKPDPREGQKLAWKHPGELLQANLLSADGVIVDAIRLPPVIPVTPPLAPNGDDVFLDELELLAPSQALVCLRRPDLALSALLDLAAGAACRLEGSDARLILHGNPIELAPLVQDPPAVLRARLGDRLAGIHVPARFLVSLSQRPVSNSLWFGASCHSADELHAANAVGANYAFLGPVQATASHPGDPGMGWPRFEELVRDLPLPVYAIGGLGPEDLETAWEHGAQGIAAIRSFWPG